MDVEERVEVAKKICDLYATDEYTIQSCCSSEGIDYRTFLNWTEEGNKQYDSQISELYKNSKLRKRKASNSELVKLARRALKKKLDMMTYKETTTIEEQGAITNTKTVTKTVIPSAADIALALNNLDDDFDDHREQNEKGFDLSEIANAIRKVDKKDKKNRETSKKKN